MSKKTPNQIEKVIEYADNMADKGRKDFRDYLDGQEWGVKVATPEQDIAFVRLMIAKYPPQWFVFPDGREEFNSPWVIALREKYVDAPGAWRGVKAALEKIGPLPMPDTGILTPVGAPASGPPAAAPLQPPPIPVAPPQGSSPMSPRFLTHPNVPMGMP